MLDRLGLGAGGRDVEGALTEWFRSRSGDDAVRRLTAAGLPAAPARRAHDLLWDTELLDEQVLQVHHRDDGSPYYAAGRFARFARTQRSGVLLAPGLGEHSREVLAGVGLEEATIEELVSRGVVVEGGPLSVQAFFEYR